MLVTQCSCVVLHLLCLISLGDRQSHESTSIHKNSIVLHDSNTLITLFSSDVVTPTDVRQTSTNSEPVESVGSAPVLRSNSISARDLPEAFRSSLGGARADPTMISRLLDWRSRPNPGAPRTPIAPQTPPPAKSPLFPRVNYPGTSSSSGLVSGDASAVGSVLDLTAVFRSQLTQPSLLTDISTVRTIRGVKTDIGLARAFVRLSLEKKLLSAHLTRLLMDVKLLR